MNTEPEHFVARLSGAGAYPVTLAITAPWDQFGDIRLVGGLQADQERIRDWLRDAAAGMFGHLIASDETARPCDVHHALTAHPNDPEIRAWNPQIILAHVRTVSADLPEGAVT